MNKMELYKVEENGTKPNGIAVISKEKSLKQGNLVYLWK